MQVGWEALLGQMWPTAATGQSPVLHLMKSSFKPGLTSFTCNCNKVESVVQVLEVFCYDLCFVYFLLLGSEMIWSSFDEQV